MKKIICDQFGLHQLQAGDYLVKDEQQYEKAYEILNSPEKQNVGCIVVTNPALFHWFDAPAKKVAWPIIHLDPVAELAKRLNRLAVERILKNHPEWVVELGLLQKVDQVEIGENETAESWLRRVLLGLSWKEEEEITDESLSEILHWLANHDEQNLHPLTHKLLKEQLDKWSAGNSGKAKFFRWLKRAPFQRAKILAWQQMLCQYPSNVVSSWFQGIEEWNSLSVVPDYTSFPNLEIPLPKGTAVFLKTFLDEEWECSPLQALSYISGRLPPEQDFLVAKLRSYIRQGIQLEKEIYQKISQLDNLPEAVSLAQKLLPVKEPSLLPDTVSIGNVQVWLRDEYLPFYESCAMLKRVEKTEPFVKQFENWLKRNYSHLLIDGSGMAYRQIGKLKLRLEDGPILLYVFDGLDYLAGQDVLLPILEKAGVYPDGEITPYLAFLPSETFIAKPTLVCGWMSSQLPPERPDASFYHKLLQDSFGLAETDIISATDQDSTVYELVQNPARVYLYLDNQLDREYLHATLPPYLRREKYAAYITKQAAAIIKAAQTVKERYGVNLFIGICSDHGYTEFPAKICTLHLQGSKLLKSRSIALDDPDKFLTDENSIWRLKPDLFGLHTEMAIPIGYGCFGKKPKGAAHGGCTPQELSVPWFLLSFQKPQPAIPPTMAITGEIFRRRKVNNVTLSLSNPNDYPLSVIEIFMHGIELMTPLPLQIKPNGVGRLEACFDATSIKEAVIDIKMELTIKHRFGRERIVIKRKMETKGAMVDEFDDDFEL